MRLVCVGVWTLTGGHTYFLPYFTLCYCVQCTVGDQQTPLKQCLAEMFQQLISFYWKLSLVLFPGEAALCVNVFFLSGCISRPGTSEVQEGLFRNTQSHAKCWWEYDSVSACKEDVMWISVVCVCVCVCVRGAVCTFGPLSFRFSQSLGWCRKMQANCC